MTASWPAKANRSIWSFACEFDDAALKARIAGRFAQSGRPDDNPDAFAQRLVAYNRDTAHLLDYYRDQGKLVEVDGLARVEAVAAAIDQALARAGFPLGK